MQPIYITYFEVKLTMKKLILASLLSILIPLSITVSADEQTSQDELNNGFVAVDLMDTYRLNVTPHVDTKNSFTGKDKKVLFFDVDIMKLKLNYDFKNTETAIKKVLPE